MVEYDFCANHVLSCIFVFYLLLRSISTCTHACAPAILSASTQFKGQFCATHNIDVFLSSVSTHASLKCSFSGDIICKTTSQLCLYCNLRTIKYLFEFFARCVKNSISRFHNTVNPNSLNAVSLRTTLIVRCSLSTNPGLRLCMCVREFPNRISPLIYKCDQTTDTCTIPCRLCA